MKLAKRNYVNDVVALHCFTEEVIGRNVLGLRTYFKNLIFTPVKKLVPGVTVFEERVDLIVRRIAEILVDRFSGVPNRNDPEWVEPIINQVIRGDKPICNLVPHHDSNRDFVAELISFMTTGDRYSKFLFGLQEQVLSPDYNLRQSVSWIRAEMENSKSFSVLLDNPIKIKYRCFNFRIL